MKRFLLTIMLLVLALTSCSSKNLKIEQHYNEYWVNSCVYAGTAFPQCDIATDTYKDNASYIIYEDFFQIDIYNTGFTLLYQNVDYRRTKAITKMNDNLDSNKIITEFKYRYDVYSNNEFTGQSIFINEKGVHVGELVPSDKEYILQSLFLLKTKSFDEILISNFFKEPMLSINEFEIAVSTSDENNLIKNLPDTKCYENDVNSWYRIDNNFLLKIYIVDGKYCYNLGYFENGKLVSTTTDFNQMLSFIYQNEKL